MSTMKDLETFIIIIDCQQDALIIVAIKPLPFLCTRISYNFFWYSHSI